MNFQFDIGHMHLYTLLHKMFLYKNLYNEFNMNDDNFVINEHFIVSCFTDFLDLFKSAHFKRKSWVSLKLT